MNIERFRIIIEVCEVFCISMNSSNNFSGDREISFSLICSLNPLIVPCKPESSFHVTLMAVGL